MASLVGSALLLVLLASSPMASWAVARDQGWIDERAWSEGAWQWRPIQRRRYLTPG
jgi:hypothetical protein